VNRADEGPDGREQRGVEWAARHRQITGDVLDDKLALLITATRLRCAVSPCERFLPAIRGVHLVTVLGIGAASSPRPRRSNGAEEAHVRAFQRGQDGRRETNVEHRGVFLRPDCRPSSRRRTRRESLKREGQRGVRGRTAGPAGSPRRAFGTARQRRRAPTGSCMRSSRRPRRTTWSRPTPAASRESRRTNRLNVPC